MTTAAPPRLDIVIPVYNEGANILQTLQSIAREVATPKRVLICYDREDDDTLPAIGNNHDTLGALTVAFVRNRGRGAHGAVLTGFVASEAPFADMFSADDDYNAGILDAMVAQAESGCDIVCASRFMPGGSMVDCPWLKAALLRTGKTPTGAAAAGHIRRLVRHIRSHWPTTHNTIRGDGHYGRPEVMDWCEANGVDYVLAPAHQCGAARRSRNREDRRCLRGEAGDQPGPGPAQLCRNPLRGEELEVPASCRRPH